MDLEVIPKREKKLKATLILKQAYQLYLFMVQIKSQQKNN